MNSAADWYAEQEYRERCGMPHEGESMPKQKISNADRIRQMTDEELADFLNTLTYNCCDGKCCDCPVSGYEDVEGDCSVEEWLRKEADEDD